MEETPERESQFLGSDPMTRIKATVGRTRAPGALTVGCASCGGASELARFGSDLTNGSSVTNQNFAYERGPCAS